MNKGKYAVISYWCGELETSNVWIYDSYEDAKADFEKFFNQSINLAKEDENYIDNELFYDSAVVRWDDGLERWFEIVPVNENKEQIL